MILHALLFPELYNCFGCVCIKSVFWGIIAGYFYHIVCVKSQNFLIKISQPSSQTYSKKQGAYTLLFMLLLPIARIALPASLLFFILHSTRMHIILTVLSFFISFWFFHLNKTSQ